MTAEFETTHHGAWYHCPWPLAGSIRCMITGGRDAGHYVLFRSGGQFGACQVLQVGSHWMDAGNATWWPSEAAAVQAMEDLFLGVTRIRHDGGTERYLHGKRLADALCR